MVRASALPVQLAWGTVPLQAEGHCRCVSGAGIPTRHRQILYNPRDNFNVIHSIRSACFNAAFSSENLRLRLLGFPWEPPFSSIIWGSLSKELAADASNFHYVIGTCFSSFYLFAQEQVTTLWVIKTGHSNWHWPQLCPTGSHNSSLESPCELVLLSFWLYCSTDVLEPTSSPSPPQERRCVPGRTLHFPCNPTFHTERVWVSSWESSVRISVYTSGKQMPVVRYAAQTARISF